MVGELNTKTTVPAQILTWTIKVNRKDINKYYYFSAMLLNLLLS